MLRNLKIGQPHGYLGFTVNHPDKCKVVTAGKAELQKEYTHTSFYENLVKFSN
jgi:hypothetical protein